MLAVRLLVCLLFASVWGHEKREATSVSFYKWEELHVLQETFEKVRGFNTSSRDLNMENGGPDSHQGKLSGRPLASQLVGGTPVYISLTTIHNRLYGIAATIESILLGKVLPTHIYIFVSSEPYLLDQGISKDFMISSSGKLRALSDMFPHISVVFTENIGPHRKLLPLLARKWEEDCVIVTVDDHEVYPKGMLSSLLEYYRASDGTAVVALRSRRMGICADAPPWRVSPYTKKHKGLWPETKPGRREMLMLPTGTGGVLYRPQFFHPIIFDRRFLNLTRTGDDLMFRLATMAKGIAVVTACTEYEGQSNVCPSKHELELSLSMQVTPLFAPQLRSIKPADVEELPGKASRKANTAQASNSARIAERLAGSSTKRKTDGTAEAAVADGGAPHKLAVPRRGSASKESHYTTILQEEITAALEERDQIARTLQQTKETKVAVLNEMGNLRHRRLSSVHDFDKNSGDFDFSGPIEGGAGGSQSSSSSSSGSSSSIDAGLSTSGGTRTSALGLPAEGGGENDRHPQDMRKKESLASKFNALGGNNVMWAQSVSYLAHMGVLDFETALQFYAPLERMPCVLLSGVFSKGAGRSQRGFVSNFLDSIRVSLQNIYNHECGILLW